MKIEDIDFECLHDLLVAHSATAWRVPPDAVSYGRGVNLRRSLDKGLLSTLDIQTIIKTYRGLATIDAEGAREGKAVIQVLVGLGLIKEHSRISDLVIYSVILK